MFRCIAIVAVPVAAMLMAVGMTTPASTQTDGWITLLDETKMGDWNQLGEGNWRLEDGVVVVDKRGKDAAYLITKDAYGDFQLRAEFWVSDNANSGIYMRCSDPSKITDKTCYEANIFDQRSDPTFGTGAIVHIAKVEPVHKAGGKWNTFDITLKGPQLTVIFNGVKTADVQDSQFSKGPLALQYASGMVKFRKVQIKPL